MNCNRVIRGFILVGLCATSSVQSRDLGFFDCVIGAGLIGGVACAVNYLFPTSTPQVIENAESVCLKEGAYRSLCADIEAHYGINSTYASYPDKKYAINLFNETILYAIAYNHFDKDARSASSVLFDLKNDIHAIKKNQSAIFDRLQKLRHNREEIHLHQRMDSLYHTMTDVLTRLEFVHDYISKHESYFNLYRLEDKLWKRYDRETQALTDYSYDRYYLDTVFKESIACSGFCEWRYLSYIEQLEKDFDNLSYAVNTMAYHYPDRISWAHQLLGHFTSIKVKTKALPEYFQEERDAQLWRLEQQRIAVACEQAEAQRRTARALEQQNRMTREQVEAQHRAASALEEQNRIDREVLRRHAQDDLDVYVEFEYDMDL